MEQYDFYFGIDLGSTSHAVCCVDHLGKVVERKSFRHSPEALTDLIGWILSHAEPAQMAMSIEVPRGAIVDTLLERGVDVYSINPKQVDRFRDRYSVAGCKDDDRDAFVLADTLRTDTSLYRRVLADDPRIIQLREATRMEDELEKSMRVLSNRLWSSLNRVIPQLLEISPGADDRWLWTLLAHTKGDLKSLRKFTKARIGSVLKKHRIRKVTSSEVQKHLKAGTLTLVDGTVDAVGRTIDMLVAQLKVLDDQLKANKQYIDKILHGLETDTGKMNEHSDAKIILSFKGIGNKIAARMLSEASQLLAERNYKALRVHSGVAPVTKRSGKTKLISIRKACNVRLRLAVHHWAGVAVLHDDRAKLHYARQRQKGNSHSRALRSVGDHLLRRLTAMLEKREIYRNEPIIDQVLTGQKRA